MQPLDDDPTIPVVHLESTPTPRDKSLRTNHPCALCDVYGHYSHHCPDLPDFRLALHVLNNPVLETENLTIREILPLYLDPETSQLPIVEIHPPESSASEEFKNIYMFSSVTSPLEQRLLSLEQTDEDRRATLQNIEAAKTRS